MSVNQENPLENQPGNPAGQPENINPQNAETPPNYTAPPTPPPFQAPPAFGQFWGNYGGQQNLPNATASLILGILSIPACCFYGFFGIIFGIIAVILANGDIKKYQMNPNFFTEVSYKNTKAGKICGIIGLSLSALFFVFWVLILVGLFSYPALFHNFGRF
ncbi:hypothetical protein ABIB40_003447 [Pedobacter sp. UYP30]|uniref:CCC motif membrane protein n=1 Tax=Pedobacter sp. UYP30 TaxID=1756400 RepID=UPI003391FC92